MKKITKKIVFIAALLSLLSFNNAYAIGIYNLQFDMLYDPTGTSYENGTLDGMIEVLYENSGGNFQTYDLLGNFSIGGLSPGDSIIGNFDFIVDPKVDGDRVVMRFSGGWVSIIDPKVDGIVYAFDEGTKTVSSEPGAAPFIELGAVFPGGSGPVFNISTPYQELPLFAFSSAGEQIGIMNVDIAQVPEPGTLLLLGSGLIGLGFFRRKREAA